MNPGKEPTSPASVGRNGTHDSEAGTNGHAALNRVTAAASRPQQASGPKTGEPPREIVAILNELRLSLRQSFGLDARSVRVDWRKKDEEPFTAPMTAIRDDAEQEEAKGYTPCTVDILSVLTEVGRRLSTTQLLSELESRDLIHGESTVKIALARMTAEGKEIDNPKKDGRHVGYGLIAVSRWADMPARRLPHSVAGPA